MHIFFRIMPLFRLYILSQAPHSRVLASACNALVITFFGWSLNTGCTVFVKDGINAYCRTLVFNP